jgi:soluble lytic murein transglycosylase-like protein
MWAESFFRELEEAVVPHDFLRFIAWVIVGALSLICVLPAFGQVPMEANAYRREYVRIVRSEWGLDAPVATLAAQIQQESAWNCRAVSRVGAKGCAQFMPATALWIGEVDRTLREGDVYSPAWAFRAQATYMQWLHARIKASDECNRVNFALAAYNGGLGYVYRRQKLSKRPGVCVGATCDINPGITAANQRENSEYPRRITAIAPRYDRWGPRACL